MEEFKRPQSVQYFDFYQKIITGFVAGTFIMMIVLVMVRLMVLDDLPKRAIVDDFRAVNIVLHFASWAWFAIRSATFKMRLKEANKEKEDI